MLPFLLLLRRRFRQPVSSIEIVRIRFPSPIRPPMIRPRTPRATQNHVADDVVVVVVVAGVVVGVEDEESSKKERTDENEIIIPLPPRMMKMMMRRRLSSLQHGDGGY